MASRVTPPRPSHARARNGHLCGVLWTKRLRLLSTCNELEDRKRTNSRCLGYVRFSNRPSRVKHFKAIHHFSVDVASLIGRLIKHFKAIHHFSVDVAHGLALLFGL